MKDTEMVDSITSSHGPVQTMPPIALYEADAPGSEGWLQQERQYHSAVFGTEVVANVVAASLTPVLPAEPNGTAIIVAPGGGFHALSINSEGFDVANWLAARGYSAFVLKYRLVETGEDAPAEMLAGLDTSRASVESKMAAVAPLAGADGKAAVVAVRARAEGIGVRTDRIGFVGFSAGGNVGAQVGLGDDARARPDFLALLYPSLRGLHIGQVPADSGPLFVAAATDDQLGLVPDSISLYEAWVSAGLLAELHLYHRGGHGFGMRGQGLPVDSWIDRFGDWLKALGLA